VYCVTLIGFQIYMIVIRALTNGILVIGSGRGARGLKNQNQNIEIILFGVVQNQHTITECSNTLIEKSSTLKKQISL